jgi:hypothetical protein
MGFNRHNSQKLWSSTAWKSAWKNLQTTLVPDENKSIWYIFVHDIIPTNEQLHKIRLAASNRCKHCDKQDTFEHRLTEYSDGIAMRDWTRQHLALMLRSDWPEYQQKGPFALS